MQRPEVRVIEYQQETSQPQDVSSSEAAALLAKYGFAPQVNTTNNITKQPDDVSGMTIEQIMLQQQAEQEYQRQKEYQRKYGPKAATFNSDRIAYSESNYRNIDDTNFGIQVQVVSDMPINNNSQRRF